MSIRLLIVDDHRVFCEGLEAVLSAEPGMEPLEPVSDPYRVIDIATAAKPDAVIMDVRLGRVSGIDLTAQLVTLPSAPLVVVLTAYPDAATAISAIRAGAVGFVAKYAAAEHVVAAVRAAVLGGTWLPAGLLHNMLAEVPDPPETPCRRLFDQLTAREQEVLALMVNGFDRQCIAGKLCQSPNTVRTHIHNVTAKLGCHSALEAVAVALRAGLRPELRQARVPARPGGTAARPCAAVCPDRSAGSGGAGSPGQRPVSGVARNARSEPRGRRPLRGHAAMPASACRRSGRVRSALAGH
jgi:DNA-binding NarL/FixJ family response regulator